MKRFLIVLTITLASFVSMGQITITDAGDAIRVSGAYGSWMFSKTGLMIQTANNDLEFIYGGRTYPFPFTYIDSPSYSVLDSVYLEVSSWLGGTYVFSGGITSDTIISDYGEFDTLQVNKMFQPDANDGAPLGYATRGFSDLFLAEGGVINWDNGDATLTQVGNMVTLAGADLTVPTLTGTTLTDGTLTITAGDISSGNIWGADSLTVTYLTDGTATLVGGDLTGGTIEGTTLTDGSLTITGGDISSGNIWGADSLTVTYLTDGTLSIIGGDIASAGTIEGTTFEDGVLTITTGNISSGNIWDTDSLTVNYLTDGTATLVGGDFTGGTIEGTTITDGTLSITGGNISSGNIWGADSLTINYLTDGTATLVGGDFSGGTVEGTTLTDGTLSISAGSITSGNVFNADSVHANWFGGSDFELGESGSDITIDADTIKSVGVINGLTSLTDGTATWNALHNLTGFNLIGADTVTANYFSGTVIGGLYWSDTTAAGGVGIATAFDISDMLNWSDTTATGLLGIATAHDLTGYVTPTYTGNLSITGNIYTDSIHADDDIIATGKVEGTYKHASLVGEDVLTVIPFYGFKSINDGGYNYNGIYDGSAVASDSVIFFAWGKADMSESYAISVDSNLILICSGGGGAKISIGDATNNDDAIDLHGDIYIGGGVGDSLGVTIPFDVSADFISSGDVTADTIKAVHYGGRSPFTIGTVSGDTSLLTTYDETHSNGWVYETKMQILDTNARIYLSYPNSHAPGSEAFILLSADNDDYTSTISVAPIIVSITTDSLDIQAPKITATGDMTLTGGLTATTKIAATDSICLGSMRFVLIGDSVWAIKGADSTNLMR